VQGEHLGALQALWVRMPVNAQPRFASIVCRRCLGVAALACSLFELKLEACFKAILTPMVEGESAPNATELIRLTQDAINTLVEIEINETQSGRQACYAISALQSALALIHGGGSENFDELILCLFEVLTIFLDASEYDSVDATDIIEAERRRTMELVALLSADADEKLIQRFIAHDLTYKSLFELSLAEVRYSTTVS
jgi:hypothetical protein